MLSTHAGRCPRCGVTAVKSTSPGVARKRRRRRPSWRAGLRPVTSVAGCGGSISRTCRSRQWTKWVSIFAPARPMLPTRDRHEIGTDIDVDVAHVGVSHGTALMMVGDQPLDDRALAGTGIEVHGIAACVPRWPPSAGNHGTRPARRYKFDGAELRLDPLQERARGRCQAGAWRVDRIAHVAGSRLRFLGNGVVSNVEPGVCQHRWVEGEITAVDPTSRGTMLHRAPA